MMMFEGETPCHYACPHGYFGRQKRRQFFYERSLIQRA